MAHFKPESLKELFEDLKDYWNAVRLIQQDSKEWYYQQKDVNIDLPDGITSHRSATPTLIIDEIREQFRMDEPRVTAKTKGKGKKDFERKGLQEMWGRNILRQLSTDAYMNPLLQPPFDFPLLGQAAIKWLPKTWVLDTDPPVRHKSETKKLYDERLEDWEFMRDAEGYFDLRALDPVTIFPEPGTRTPTYVLEVQTRRFVDMMQGDFDHPFDVAKFQEETGSESPLEQVQWLEYWSWMYDPEAKDWYGHYIVEAGGQIVIDKENVLKHVPYSIRFSGLGRRDESNDPVMMAVGVLQAIKGELDAEMTIKTAMASQWLFHAFPQLLAPDTKTAGAWAKIFMKGPASVVVYPSDDPQGAKALQWMDAPAPNADMLNFLDRIESNIARVARSGFRGESQGASGVQDALLLGQQQKLLGPVKEQIDLMGADILTGLAKIMDVFDLTMNVSGIGDEGEDRMVSGADLRHPRFEVSFEAVDAAEDDRLMLTLASIWEKGGITWRTFAEKGLKNVIENVDEEEIQKNVEAVMAIMMQTVLPDLVIQGIIAKQGEQQLAESQEAAGEQANESITGAQEVLGTAERGLAGLMGETGTDGGADATANPTNTGEVF